VLILWDAVVERGYATQSWLTFRQSVALGGHVRKGERGTTVVYADRFVPDDVRDRARERGEQPRGIPFLKRFTVFNVEQCAALPDGIAAPPPAVGLHGQSRPRAPGARSGRPCSARRSSSPTRSAGC
jgi:antirestriction protein ArdC